MLRSRSFGALQLIRCGCHRRHGGMALRQKKGNPALVITRLVVSPADIDEQAVNEQQQTGQHLQPKLFAEHWCASSVLCVWGSAFGNAAGRKAQRLYRQAARRHGKKKRSCFEANQRSECCSRSSGSSREWCKWVRKTFDFVPNSQH